MSELPPISINRNHTQEVFKKYTNTASLELLSVLGQDNNVIPKDQNQTEDNITFHDSTILEAKNELLKKGEQEEHIEVNHQHERENGHGFGFSQEDLDTAKHLDTQGIKRMGLIMNGLKLSDGSRVQHKITANHKGELHDLTGENGERGKVVSMFTDEKGEENMIYSQSIEDAEKKEALIVSLKDLLFEQPDMKETIQISQVLKQAA